MINLRDGGTVNTIKMGLEKGARTTSRIFFVGLSRLHNLIHGPLQPSTTKSWAASAVCLSGTRKAKFHSGTTVMLHKAPSAAHIIRSSLNGSYQQQAMLASENTSSRCRSTTSSISADSAPVDEHVHYWFAVSAEQTCLNHRHVPSIPDQQKLVSDGSRGRARIALPFPLLCNAVRDRILQAPAWSDGCRSRPFFLKKQKQKQIAAAAAVELSTQPVLHFIFICCQRF